MKCFIFDIPSEQIIKFADTPRSLYEERPFRCHYYISLGRLSCSLLCSLKASISLRHLTIVCSPPSLPTLAHAIRMSSQHRDAESLPHHVLIEREAWRQGAGRRYLISSSTHHDAFRNKQPPCSRSRYTFKWDFLTMISSWSKALSHDEAIAILKSSTATSMACLWGGAGEAFSSEALIFMRMKCIGRRGLRRRGAGDWYSSASARQCAFCHAKRQRDVSLAERRARPQRKEK